ncbi:pyridoxal/pyridoxine/pyridoxamine kinase [Salpingoeca rosetta]|uniref:pyridoxal kinase n=1 Tax=Salpingoeca rosetta (strain ATCC 50818 / BSB-021) TaxID=946362 RepID=F2TW08_SALR5|nr:pyridoxal/pyridoxine/pyridoxamine kinase [Salpingoeca rosetta]EGD72254.1 pyridoxal/pyridoxine/pyridoxamine kinase [Salpingoeca rosetta]|eukprot:XP_004998825.1 pyridoxal/pyridoxine/pyridoxamine kinase [Salpingoeca rosetta]
MARVLSIQSHVVHGYVGNKAATFPLQVLGFEVDAINSVQFSNHTGYSQVKGTKQTAEELWDLFSGLEHNDLLSYTHILTGYVGSAEFLSTVVRIVRKLKEPAHQLALPHHYNNKVNPDIVTQSSETMANSTSQQLIPLADIVTPNQFELEMILECDIKSEAMAFEALQRCLALGIKHAVLTSFHGDTRERITLLGCAHPQRSKEQAEAAQGSTADGDGGDGDVTSELTRYRLTVPRFDFYFTGTGDLLSALILARTWEAPADPMTAVAKAAASLQGVCQHTYEYCRHVEAPTARHKELRLIQSKHQDHIESPDLNLLRECEKL